MTRATVAERLERIGLATAGTSTYTALNGAERRER